MNRRDLLKRIAALPLVGWFLPGCATAKPLKRDLIVGPGQWIRLHDGSEWGTITVNGGWLVTGQSCSIDSLILKSGSINLGQVVREV